MRYSIVLMVLNDKQRHSFLIRNNLLTNKPCHRGWYIEHQRGLICTIFRYLKSRKDYTHDVGTW